ncbi:MAG: hypothetical protein N3A57_05525 [Negativicutes bacterium]|nr:hypothetical protein [Negativicutes bacterium]
MAAFVLGLVVAVIVAVVYDQINRTFWTADGLDFYLRLPVPGNVSNHDTANR